MNLVESDPNPAGAMPANNPWGDAPDLNPESHHWVVAIMRNFRLGPRPWLNPDWIEEIIDQIYALEADHAAQS